MEEAAVFFIPTAVDGFASEVDDGLVAGKVEGFGGLPVVDAGKRAISRAADAGGGDAIFREQGGQAVADEAGDSEDGDALDRLHGVILARNPSGERGFYRIGRAGFRPLLHGPGVLLSRRC